MLRYFPQQRNLLILTPEAFKFLRLFFTKLSDFLANPNNQQLVNTIHRIHFALLIAVCCRSFSGDTTQSNQALELY